jgi:hypothetical protein
MKQALINDYEVSVEERVLVHGWREWRVDDQVDNQGASLGIPQKSF